MKLTRKASALAAGATVAAVLAAGTAAAASSPTPSATSTPKASSSASGGGGGKDSGKRHGHRGLAERAEHGQLFLHGKSGDKVVDLQRGTVTAVTAAAAGKPASVTVTSKDGFRATYVFTSQSKVRNNRAKGSAPSVKVGEVVRLRALQKGSTKQVLGLAAHTPRVPHTKTATATPTPSAT